MTGLRELTDTLVAIVSEGGAAPQRICAVCVDELPVTGAAISLVAGDEYQEPVFATDHVAGELDELQFRLGEGPSVEASNRCRPVQITDLADISDSPLADVRCGRTPNPPTGCTCSRCMRALPASVCWRSITSNPASCRSA